MDLSHHGVREVPLPFVASGLCLGLPEPVIELLHVVPGDGAELSVAQRRTDVVLDQAAVTADGAGAERRLCVAREPALRPFVQREVPTPADLHSPVVVDGFVQLRYQFLLRFGEHGFVDQRAVLLVSDDDAPFPAAVCALAHQAFPVRSFTHPPPPLHRRPPSPAARPG